MAQEIKDIAYWDEYDAQGIGVGGYTDTTLLESLSKGAALEVGCGRGGKIASLPNLTRRCGIDYSDRAIRVAREAHPEVEFEVADACRLPYVDGTFDLVFSIEVIEHVEHYEEMIDECHRVLKPGGTLFIQTPNYPAKRFYDFVHFLRAKRKNLSDDYSHVSKFSAASLVRAVARRFDVQIVETRNILGERAIPPLMRLRESRSPISLLVGQKTIVVAKKATL